MFTQSAALYDKLYAARGKDYRLEAEALARYTRSVAPHARTPQLPEIAFGRPLYAGRRR